MTDILERNVSQLANMARRAGVELDSDAVRWFVAEMTDRDPEQEDPFLDRISDSVWFRLLATA